MATEIRVLNASSLKVSDLRGMAGILESIFCVPVSIGPAELDLARVFDASRRQSNSTALLAQILQSKEPSGRKRIAVVDVDLFIPVLTFVFGEAQLNGTAAVVSTHRLSNRAYGLPENRGLLLERLEKEIVHELGHTFGLYHCHQFECVMRSSTYVEEIDLKRSHPCDTCASALGASPRRHSA